MSASTTARISPLTRDSSWCGPRFSSSSLTRPRRRRSVAPTAARADLRIWLKRQKPSFDSLGACRAASGGLSCGGSVSAAEADDCKSDRDGVHRNCRIIRAANAGAFGVVAQPDGVVVTIQRQLELVQAPYDGGPFLYLSPGNVENHAFALKPAPEAACK